MRGRRRDEQIYERWCVGEWFAGDLKVENKFMRGRNLGKGYLRVLRYVHNFFPSSEKASKLLLNFTQLCESLPIVRRMSS